MYSQEPLKLEVFRDLERSIMMRLWVVPGAGYLVRGVLLPLEQWYINQKSRMTVDAAIAEYQIQEKPQVPPVEQVVVSEGPSEVMGLPELRMSSTIPGLKLEDRERPV